MRSVAAEMAAVLFVSLLMVFLQLGVPSIQEHSPTLTGTACVCNSQPERKFGAWALSL